jgi:ribosomal protein S18 acetylase RimI-like enzyme
MISVRPATHAEAQDWYGIWHRRMADWYASHGAPGMHVRRTDAWDADPGEVFSLVSGAGTVAGFVALAVREGMSSITDIWIEPTQRGQGYGRAARTHADAWAAAHEPRISATVTSRDPAAEALFADLPLRAQRMIKRLGAAPDLPPGAVARPMRPDEFAAWRNSEIAGYAADMSGSGIMDEAKAREVSVQSYDEMLPDGIVTPGYTWWCVDVEGTTVATIWVAAAIFPGLSFVYSVETGVQHRGRGYGRAAMLVGERATLDAGDTHLGLNVFGHNTVAMRLYDSLGYHIVDQSRSS